MLKSAVTTNSAFLVEETTRTMEWACHGVKPEGWQINNLYLRLHKIYKDWD